MSAGPDQSVSLPRPRVAALSLLLVLFVACGSTPASRGGMRIDAPAVAAERRSEAPARRALAPLTERERALAGELRRDVELLAGSIGERNLEKEWNLATATDEVALALESEGYEVERHGFSVGEDVVQNLEVVVPGGIRGRQAVIVGAHLDTHPGSPGADDNASGVAAVLALARGLRGIRGERTLKLVIFVNEEQPYFQTEQMGSFVYARELATSGMEVVAMLSLESIGYFSDAPGSQRYPEAIAGRYPTTGDFIAIIGNSSSSAVLERVTSLMKKHATLPVVGDVLPEELPGVAWSDHWAFWRLGMPAVMVTATAPFRNPNYHLPSDRPDTLDYERMARVVMGLQRTVEQLISRKEAAGAE